MKLWKNILSLMIGNGTTEVIGFVFLFILVRIYDQHDYALYKQGYLLVATLLPFLMLGLPIALSYYIPKTEDARLHNTYILNTALATAALAALGSVGVIVFGETIAQAYNNADMAAYMGYFSGIMLGEALFAFYPYCMVALNQVRTMVKVTAGFAFLRIGTLLFCILMNAPMDMLIALLFANAVLKAGFILMFLMRRFQQHGAAWDSRLFVTQSLFAIPLGVSLIIYGLMNVLDKNLTALFYSPLEFAIYINGVYTIPFVTVLTGSISSGLLPKLSALFDKDDPATLDACVAEWHRTTVAASIVLIPLIFVLMTFAQEVVSILFTDVYARSAPIFRINMLFMLTKLTNFGLLLTVAARQRDLVYASIASVAAEGVIYLVIHFVWGFDYIVWATVIANFVLVLTMLWHIRREYHRTILNVYPWKPTFVLIGIGLALMWLFYALKGLVTLPPVYSLALLGGVMYGAGVLLGTVFVTESRDLLVYVFRQRVMPILKKQA